MSRKEELEALIKRYQRSYYNGEGEISDEEFDALWDELRLIDKDNALFSEVASDDAIYKKTAHIMPMGSQQKASNEAEFLAWIKKIRTKFFLVEYKMDGASLEMQYENGKLKAAVTRGDGKTGDDVTFNAVKMLGVKKSLKGNFSGAVRGEVLMSRKVHAEKYSALANCRNAANGIMKRKDGEGAGDLQVVVYDVFSKEKGYFTDEEAKLDFLRNEDFCVVNCLKFTEAEEIINYRSKISERRGELEFDIDGLVIKSFEIDEADAWKARPEKQIAFKFETEKALTTLKAVEWSTSGATYTPIAIFDEVSLNGTKVSRASLANPDLIRKMHLKIGSKIIVVKRGEIIPKVESLAKSESEDGEKEREISFPTECESCSSPLVDEGSRLYCPNKDCEKRSLHKLEKWLSASKIKEIGEALLLYLFKTQKVRRISDFYRLSESDLEGFFLSEESLRSKKLSLGAANVIKSIEESKTMTLQAFVSGFDIENIGELSASKLVESGFDTLEKLFSMSEAEAMEVEGFAEITAKAVVGGLLENKEEMKEVRDKYIKIISPSKGKFTSLSFCFTGKLNTMKRAEIEELVRKNGGEVKSSVVKNLSFLVTNDTTTSSAKNKKALASGVKVISEEEFLEMLHSY